MFWFGQAIDGQWSENRNGIDSSNASVWSLQAISVLFDSSGWTCGVVQNDTKVWGPVRLVWVRGMGRRLPKRTPRGKRRSAVMIRFVQWFDLVYYLQCDETTDDCGKHDVACDESGDRGKPGDDWWNDEFPCQPAWCDDYDQRDLCFVLIDDDLWFAWSFWLPPWVVGFSLMYSYKYIN